MNGFEKFWQKVWHGTVDVAKFVVDVPAKLPKVIVLVDELKSDGSNVIPELTKLASDVEQIVAVGGKDAVAFLAASKLIWPAIAAAVAAKGENVTLDLSVLAQVKPILEQGETFANVIPLFEPLFSDFETFAKSLDADAQKLLSDAEAVSE